MPSNFGPWTTSLNSATRLELSAFWRERMARLPDFASGRSRLTPTGGLGFFCLMTFVALEPLLIAEDPLTAIALAVNEATQPTSATASSRPASEKIQQGLATSTTVQFVDRPLIEALESVGRQHNIPIRIERDALAAADVSLEKPLFLNIAGVSLRTVLYMLLEQDSLGYIVDGDEIVVTTRKLADSRVEEIAYELGDVARAGVSLTDLGDAIVHSIEPSTWQVQGSQGRLRIEQTRLVVRQRAEVQRQVQSLLSDLERALVAVPGTFENEPLETRSYAIGDLRKGASETNLGNWLRDVLLVPTWPDDLGRVDLTIAGDQMRLKQSPWVHAAAVKYLSEVRKRLRQKGPEAGTHDDFAFARNGMRFEANRQQSRRQLAIPVSVEFLDLPTEDGLTFIKEYTRVNIWLNLVEVRRLRIKLDRPLTFKAANEPLSKLLDTVLMPLRMDWSVLEPGVVIINPQPEDGPRMEPRVYGIQELRDAGHTIEGLKSLITDLDPGSWAPAGGRASMQSLAPGFLIVVQSRIVHDQIDKLIEKLLPKPAK